MKSCREDLGSIVKDNNTGLKGILVARCEWQHGCVRVTIQPQGLGKDGKPQEMHTTDEQNVTILKPVKKVAKPSGGPHDAPKMYPDQKR